MEKHFVKKGGIETAGAVAPAAPDSEQSRQLRELLSRTLTFAVASLLSGTPALVAEAESLGAATKAAHSEEALAEIAVRLKQLCYQIELKSGDTGEQQELLLRLFKLLLENVSELLDDDSWLRGQIEAVQELIAGPLDQRALEEATRSLKEVIYKQSQLKHSISDVKLTVKNMMMTFIDRLGVGGGVDRRLPRKDRRLFGKDQQGRQYHRTEPDPRRGAAGNPAGPDRGA